MARIRADKLERVMKENPKVHEVVEGSLSVYEIKGEKYLQIDTYGRDSRKFTKKVSQSIQIDREMAAFLINLLVNEVLL